MLLLFLVSCSRLPAMQATVRAQHQTLICFLVFLPSFLLFLPYLATNKTKDEARRRRRKVRNHVQLDGYHSSPITLFGACPFDPFWFVAIIGTAAQWSLGHQAATNACSQAFPHHLSGSLFGALPLFVYRAGSPGGLSAV